MAMVYISNESTCFRRLPDFQLNSFAQWQSTILPLWMIRESRLASGGRSWHRRGAHSRVSWPPCTKILMPSVTRFSFQLLYASCVALLVHRPEKNSLMLKRPCMKTYCDKCRTIFHNLKFVHHRIVWSEKALMAALLYACCAITWKVLPSLSHEPWADYYMVCWLFKIGLY